MNKDVMQKRSGGGCLMLFGLPFFLVGMYLILGAVGVIPVKIEQNQPRILFVGFGALFASVGVLLVLGRAGLTIDRRMMKLVRWWGIGVPLKTREYHLDLFDRITIKRERRKSGNSSRTAYPVRLEGSGGCETIEYDAPADYREARRIGEELSKFLGKDLEDSSSGKKMVREPDELDESLRHRLKRTGELPELPSMPCEMRSRVEDEDGGVRIEIPPEGFKTIHLLYCVPGVIFALCVYLFFFRSFLRLPAPDSVGFVFGGFIGLFFILAPLIVSIGHALGRASMRCDIVVNSNVISVRKARLFRSEEVEIPVAELEELELIHTDPAFDAATYEKRRGRPMTAQEELQMQRMLDSSSFFTKLLRFLARSSIVARSDRQTVTFGEGLSTEELKFLHGLIIRTLTANKF